MASRSNPVFQLSTGGAQPYEGQGASVNQTEDLMSADTRTFELKALANNKDKWAVMTPKTSFDI